MAAAPKKGGLTTRRATSPTVASASPDQRDRICRDPFVLPELGRSVKAVQH